MEFEIRSLLYLAWANFRRSGYPQLAPIKFPGEDPADNTGNAGGFIRRLTYPLENYQLIPLISIRQ